MSGSLWPRFVNLHYKSSKNSDVNDLGLIGYSFVPLYPDPERQLMSGTAARKRLLETSSAMRCSSAT
jgi:hypothetical protein